MLRSSLDLTRPEGNLGPTPGTPQLSEWCLHPPVARPSFLPLPCPPTPTISPSPLPLAYTGVTHRQCLPISLPPVHTLPTYISLTRLPYHLQKVQALDYHLRLAPASCCLLRVLLLLLTTGPHLPPPPSVHSAPSDAKPLITFIEHILPDDVLSTGATRVNKAKSLFY